MDGAPGSENGELNVRRVAMPMATIRTASSSRAAMRAVPDAVEGGSAMTFRWVTSLSNNHVRARIALSNSPTGHEITDQPVHRLRKCSDAADGHLRTYARTVLHFRWWAGVHHTDAAPKISSPKRTMTGLRAIPVRSGTRVTCATINQRGASSIVPCVSPFPTLPTRPPLSTRRTIGSEHPCIVQTKAALSRLRVKDSQNEHRAYVNRRGARLVQFFAITGPGHRGIDVAARETVAGRPDLNRDDLLLSEADPCARQGKKTRFCRSLRSESTT